MKREVRSKPVMVLLFLSACSGPEQYLTKGNTAFQSGNYGDAEINYKKAIQKKPSWGEPYYRLGLTQLKEQKSVDGYQSLVKAAELDRDNDEITVTLANICLSAYMADSRRPKQLYDQISNLSQRLLAKNANSFDGLRLKGSIALIDRKPKEAIELFQSADKAKPMQPEIRARIIAGIVQDNRFEEGEKLALEFIRKEPAYPAIYEALYLQYLSANRPQDAENILKSRVANNPKDVTSALRLAEHYARVRKPVETAAALDHLIANPYFPQGPLHVGNFYGRIGDWPKAMQIFQEGARGNPSDRILYEKRIVRVLLAEGRTDDASKKGQ